MFAGESRFVRPFRDAERVAAPPRLREGPAFAWIAAPVRGSRGEVIAALGIAQPVDAVFDSILRAARPGESGDAFAFDRAGRGSSPPSVSASSTPLAGSAAKAWCSIPTSIIAASR